MMEWPNSFKNKRRRTKDLFRATILGIPFAIVLATPGLSDDWDYTITPYIWAPALDLNLDVGPNPPVSGDVSMLDVLDGALLLQGQARRGRWSFLGEFNYLNLSDDFGIAPSDPRAEWRMKGTMVSLAAGYAFYDEADTRIEAIGGIRAWDLETSTEVSNLKASKTSTFVDPMIGVRVETPLGQSFSFHGLANIGGSNFGSDRQVEAIAQVNWPWTERTSFSAGYRYLSLDFDDDQVLIDATMEGPFIAVSFDF